MNKDKLLNEIRLSMHSCIGAYVDEVIQNIKFHNPNATESDLVFATNEISRLLRNMETESIPRLPY